jgi:hypothetical protein
MNEESKRIEFISQIFNLERSNEHKLWKRLRKNRIILYSVRHNYSLLLKSFKDFRKYELEAGFWSNERPHLRWNIQKIMVTNIINYLSTISQVIDISRKNSKKELNSESYHFYEQKIKEFNTNNEFIFLRKLRNYVLHYDLLNIYVCRSVDINKGIKIYTYLNTSEILEWKEWNTKEREFIISKGKEVDIEPIIDTYHSMFMKIQDELFLSIIKNNFEDLKLLSENIIKIYSKGVHLQMTHDIPFPSSMVRYLNYLMSKA